MKISPRLEHLARCNNQLRKHSWVNFQEFLVRLLRSIDRPIARQMLSLVERQDFDALLDVADSISTTVFESAGEHLLQNQLSALIRKYPFPKGTLNRDPRKKALETYLAAEHKCSRVNRRFQLFGSLRSPHEEALNQARSWISYVLGPLRLEQIWDECDFGPGASIGIHGNATNRGRKLLALEWTVSPSAFYYAQAAMKRDPIIREYLSRGSRGPYFSFDNETFNEGFAKKVRLVDYNKIAFVPKTAKTERTIAVEPLLNGFLQKGTDLFLRKRLKRVGIDLSDQTLNQGLALFGSLSDESDRYATIDLSSASDSITTELCRYLLPPDWFDFLNQLRSRNYLLDKTVRPYEKFVSMGNGFCFPLETLIFASLCNVAYSEVHRKPDYSVYGDDIIVRASVADRVLSLLRVCGFKANPDKTFLSGPFRESCGADWFEGEDVRPINLDYAFDSIQSIFKFINLVRRKDKISLILSESLEFLETLIPPSLKFVRPYKSNVDSALEVPYDVFLASPFSKWNKNLSAWSWYELETVPCDDFRLKRFDGYELALMWGALAGAKASSPFTERRKTRTKIKRVSHGGGWSLYLPGSVFQRGERPLRV